MDFLDPKNERRARIRLLFGYGLVTLAIGIATLILLYWSYGYNVNREGDVTQNGLLFVSSQPNGAAVYLNKARYTANTNTRVVTPAGRYTLRISKAGYRDWQRSVIVAGGDVQHFDYPFLYPTTLNTSLVANLDTTPSFMAQSPDSRWLLMDQPTKSGSFTLYDLKNPAKPLVTEVVLPATVFTPGIGTQAWRQIGWAADNRHVLLQHDFTAATGAQHEYVLLDREAPASSVNLTSTLKLAQTESVSLYNNRIDQFYVYDTAAETLRRVDGSTGTEMSILSRVLAFKTYGSDKVLYVTDESPTGKTTPGKVSVVLQIGQQTLTLQTLPPAGSGAYLLDLTQYSGDWYAAVAASTDSAVYIYKNPQSQTTISPDSYPAPWRRLPLSSPSYLSFSDDGQFLLAESGQNFVTYDLENIAQYRYQTTQPMDQPQLHANWVNGDQLAYVSGGRLTVFDYDYRNQQTLITAMSGFLPAFSNDASHLYAIRPAVGTGPMALTSTSLVVH
ncbi:MAG TPA: PEGA domain-containing protein [Candidatus Saccharimonadia bacterium]|nr:PEGA domain-containing protein [Candidatus Saccharimonadia bacterium]